MSKLVQCETNTDATSEGYYANIPNYDYVNFPRKYLHPLAPGPSKGIGKFIKRQLHQAYEAVSYDESIAWIKLKSTFFGWDRDILIASIYFPPDGSSYIHSTNSRTDYFVILQEQLSIYLEEYDVILCGDLNARTGELSEIPEYLSCNEGGLTYFCDHFLHNNESYTPDLGKRVTRDKQVNEYGRCLINICKVAGLCILNGRVGNIQNTGDYTCLKENGSSTVDYVICKTNTINLIEELQILPKQAVSDHKPIQFNLIVPHIFAIRNAFTSYPETNNACL